MLRTRTGWVAQLRSGKPFEMPGNVTEGDPTGVYVAFTHVGLYVNYAGVDSRQSGIEFLPNRPSLLRELATVLNEAADAYDSGEMPPLYPLHRNAKDRKK